MSDIFDVHLVWLSLAFFAGLGAKKTGLPSLVGFISAGILLNYWGVITPGLTSTLHVLSDLGIMLLLFTIGLKMKWKTLTRPEIWVTANLHVLMTVILIGGFLFGLSYYSIFGFSDLSPGACMLVAFSLSFSSTVFVIKVLEERGEIQSYHGKLAIGILVIQDILAVLFLTFSSGKLPDLMILGLPLYLWLLYFLLNRILSQTGHEELLTLFGLLSIFIAGAAGFEFFGLKSSLGALFCGMLLVNHPKSDELYDRIMSFKDFFLIAFFINIGLTGVITIQALVISAVLMIFIPIKTGLFIYLFSHFRIRARTAFLSSLSLANYSEFALITGMVGINMGILSQDWLLIFAMLMSFSYFIASPINARIHDIYDRYKSVIIRVYKKQEIEIDEPTLPPDTETLIIGMGSLGKPAYKYFRDISRTQVIGLDYNQELVENLNKEGIHAVWGDASNSSFWTQSDFRNLKLVLLAMSDFHSNLNCLNEILKIPSRNFKICAISHYEDEELNFRELGVDYVYNYKTNTGTDFAEQASKYISPGKV